MYNHLLELTVLFSWVCLFSSGYLLGIETASKKARQKIDTLKNLLCRYEAESRGVDTYL